MYGISQNPDTKDYIVVLQYAKGENYKIRCEECNRNYVDCAHAKYERCKPCQTNSLRKNFINWTSGNVTINDFIQEMQSSICHPSDKVFEWISYNQFNDIKEMNRATVSSAIWKDGPLHY